MLNAFEAALAQKREAESYEGRRPAVRASRLEQWPESAAPGAPACHREEWEHCGPAEPEREPALSEFEFDVMFDEMESPEEHGAGGGDPDEGWE